MIDRPITPTPSVGRIVHYVAYGTPGGEYEAGVCRAAIITEVGKHYLSDSPSGNASLCVLNPEGMFFKQDLPYDEGADDLGVLRYAPGTWHWPERVE